MSIYPVIKINCLIDRNIINKIYVFYGNDINYKIEQIQDLFITDPNNELFKRAFKKS